MQAKLEISTKWTLVFPTGYSQTSVGSLGMLASVASEF